jgi:hypothetical protein
MGFRIICEKCVDYDYIATPVIKHILCSRLWHEKSTTKYTVVKSIMKPVVGCP